MAEPVPAPATAPTLFGRALPQVSGHAPRPGPPPGHWTFRGLRSSHGLALDRKLGGIDTLLPAAFSPARQVAWEFGTDRVRLMLAMHHAPMMLWRSSDWSGWHVLTGSMGMLFGNDVLRAGPHLTLGPVALFGVGGRVVWEPLQLGDTRMGPELVVTRYAPGVGEAMLLWGWTVPTLREAGLDLPLPDGWSTGAPGCERLTFGLGAGGTLFSTEGAWEYVGTSVSTSWRASPALAVTCETRDTAVRPFVGVDTAPSASYLADGEPGRGHLAALTGGVLFGNDRVRAGVHGTAGALLFGAGARLLVTPWQGRGGAWQGFELRGSLLFPGAPVGEGLILWTVGWDARQTTPRVDRPAPSRGSTAGGPLTGSGS